ncbi:MAG: hypothetical protein K0R57_5710, partial [Paenibacillaceae bacterium]|nr:hypothetical protein [Paenibacillaceae bacterium]
QVRYNSKPPVLDRIRALRSVTTWGVSEHPLEGIFHRLFTPSYRYFRLTSPGTSARKGLVSNDYLGIISSP